MPTDEVKIEAMRAGRKTEAGIQFMCQYLQG